MPKKVKKSKAKPKAKYPAICVYLDAAEKAKIEKAAEVADRSASSYILKAVMPIVERDLKAGQ